MPLKFETKSRIFMPLGALIPITAAGYGIYSLAYHRAFEIATQWIYNNAEWLGPLAVILVFLVGWLMDRQKRPFTHVPPEGSWLEFIIFGATAVAAGITIITTIAASVLFFTILIPIRAIIVHTLGPSASIASALAAIPLAYFGVGIVFAIVYFIMFANSRGNLLKDVTPLFPVPKGSGWLPAAWDTFYYSLANMLGADTAGLSPIGPTRWISLSQSLVAKALEIVIVGVGITLILNRMSS